MKSPESNYEIGPRKWFNRKDFLEQHPDWFRGFRLATREDIQPNAELLMAVVHTDRLNEPEKPFLAPEPIHLDTEPMRVIWSEDADPNETYEDKPKAVEIIDKSGKHETVSLDYFLGETCEVSPIGHLAKIYLIRS